MFFNIKYGKKCIYYYLFGMRVFKRKTLIADIVNKYEKNKAFDLKFLDDDIAIVADTLYKKSNNKFLQSCTPSKNKIVFLATELHEQGGHTECVKCLVSSLAETYEIGLFLVEKERSFKYAPIKMEEISINAKILGLKSSSNTFKASLIELYNKIIRYKPKVIFLFYNPDDILSTAVCFLIKKYTDIRLIYFNHASHLPSLGFSFSDLIIEGMPVTQYITQKFRHVDKCYVMGLPSYPLSYTKYLSKNEIYCKRKELGISEGNYFTLSGAAAYKFFDKSGSSYFQMIQRLLIKEPSLQHIVVSSFTKTELEIIEQIFESTPDVRKRLILYPFTPFFDSLFQSCDVFIDSFPMSSALTQIDVMRNKRPMVIKINKENASLSFHEYAPVGYPYMFEEIKEMEKGILNLLYDKNKQEAMVTILYNHYLQNFEGSAVAAKYCKLIEHSDRLSDFYQKLDLTYSYKISIGI